MNPEEPMIISALSHYQYCPRRCALIHIERVWDENGFTAEGKIMHDHVHDQGDETRGNVKVGRGIRFAVIAAWACWCGRCG